MNKIIALLFLLVSYSNSKIVSTQLTTNQGQVSFFSYTSVENIEAKNNQVLSVIDLSKNKIAISMLMNAFVFKKALMQEHFNESYIESDLYPKAVFEGEILDFDPSVTTSQIKLVKGMLSMRGITKEVEVETNITRENNAYVFTGAFDLVVKDFDINIPPLLVPNIAKSIAAKFRFEYPTDEK